MTLRHVFIYALFGISAFAACRPIAAQQALLSPPEIGQIADEVFENIIPPGQLVSRVSVANRKILFDHQRTMTAFGYRIATAPSDLLLRTATNLGTNDLLEDCDQTHRKICSRLGWGLYVWIAPLSVTASEAQVRVHVSWPDRGHAVFEQGIAPDGSAYLVGFVMEVELARSQSGEWKFVKTHGAKVR